MLRKQTTNNQSINQNMKAGKISKDKTELRGTNTQAQQTKMPETYVDEPQQMIVPFFFNAHA